MDEYKGDQLNNSVCIRVDLNLISELHDHDLTE